MYKLILISMLLGQAPPVKLVPIPDPVASQEAPRPLPPAGPTPLDSDTLSGYDYVNAHKAAWRAAEKSFAEQYPLFVSGELCGPEFFALAEQCSIRFLDRLPAAQFRLMRNRGWVPKTKDLEPTPDEPLRPYCNDPECAFCLRDDPWHIAKIQMRIKYREDSAELKKKAMERPPGHRPGRPRIRQRITLAFADDSVVSIPFADEVPTDREIEAQQLRDALPPVAEVSERRGNTLSITSGRKHLADHLVETHGCPQWVADRYRTNTEALIRIHKGYELQSLQDEYSETKYLDRHTGRDRRRAGGGHAALREYAGVGSASYTDYGGICADVKTTYPYKQDAMMAYAWASYCDGEMQQHATYEAAVAAATRELDVCHREMRDGFEDEDLVQNICVMKVVANAVLRDPATHYSQHRYVLQPVPAVDFYARQQALLMLAAGWTVKLSPDTVSVQWRSPKGLSGSDYESQSLDVPPPAAVRDAERLGHFRK
jgi:hypothetical protein